MPQNLAEEAIAVLLDLAQRGEIDPWDVQVIDVIDRYLQNLVRPQALEPDAADLPQSGQAFLWASMLVLLKAQTLEADQNPEADEPEDLIDDLDPVERELPARMERHIRRRPTAPPLRRRRVTLQELIAQIQQMGAVLDRKPLRSRSPSRGYTRKEAVKHITQLAHDENLTEMAAQLEQFVREVLPHNPDHTDTTILLEQLVEWWSAAQTKPATTHERVGVFWALLLLSSQSKVELSQTDFYQDLSIKPLIT
ncbi:ScpA family protein [Spirulina major CS-329]|uniref:segregation/condensation protein A n=1 Tax=Spirulina TaxID=1154 RepID=UPI00232F0B02|nr:MULTISPECIES: ScpA family protein [Spirulina]MDB9494258.1 ScpA family protein [Spirulina subsalsa CS-330]MDB9501827.1 ScpA family protein [Spirulina major CS-329]